MLTVRFLAVVAAALSVAPAVRQDFPPKPGPEQEVLKQWVGTWDATVKMMGTESKGTATYKMDLGGLWLAGSFEGEVGGMKFSGRGMDTYDPQKKKYVGVWIDSFSSAPMVMEGSYDAAKKTMTMAGTGPGVSGPQTKHRMVTEQKDNNTMNFSVYMGDGADPMITIVYRRKK